MFDFLNKTPKASFSRYPVRLLNFVCLTVLGFSCAPLMAGTAPQTVYRAATADNVLRFTVPMDRTTLVAIRGERIKSAVFDKNDIDLKTDETAGRVFIHPNRETTALLYLSAENGQTVTLELTAKENVPAHSIVLEAVKTPVSNDLNESNEPDRALMAASYTDGLLRVVRVMSTGVVPATGEFVALSSVQDGLSAQTLVRALRQQARLQVRAQRTWLTDHYRATQYVLNNTGIETTTLFPEHMTQSGLLAAGCDRRILAPGEAAHLWLVEVR